MENSIRKRGRKPKVGNKGVVDKRIENPIAVFDFHEETTCNAEDKVKKGQVCDCMMELLWILYIDSIVIFLVSCCEIVNGEGKPFFW